MIHDGNRALRDKQRTSGTQSLVRQLLRHGASYEGSDYLVLHHPTRLANCCCHTSSSTLRSLSEASEHVVETCTYPVTNSMLVEA